MSVRKQTLDDDEARLERYLPLAPEELRRLAKHLVRRRAPYPRTTSVVHETYLRLAHHRGISCQSSGHFLAIASQAMRQVLIDLARWRRAQKRGGGRAAVPLDDRLAVVEASNVDLLDLDEALRRLAELDPRRARIVELRFFGGLTMAEVARVLGVSITTVKREWPLAKTWLKREIEGGERHG